MRARNIKPGFFKNENLAELGMFERLLFIGLWCLADREGRVEDRPKRIKIELFPCDSCDVDQGLNSLASAGFIRRYAYDKYSIIEVCTFKDHQSPHGSEKDSVLPDCNGMITVNERKGNVVVTGKERLVNVNSPLGNALNPDSLIPDLPNPDSPKPEVSPDKPSSRKHAIPDDFIVSQRVEDWADKEHYLPNRVAANFSKFVLWARREGKKYVDWDAALMTAIRDDWAKVGNGEASKHNGFDSVDYRKGVSDDGSF